MNFDTSSLISIVALLVSGAGIFFTFQKTSMLKKDFQKKRVIWKFKEIASGETYSLRNDGVDVAHNVEIDTNDYDQENIKYKEFTPGMVEKIGLPHSLATKSSKIRISWTTSKNKKTTHQHEILTESPDS